VDVLRECFSLIEHLFEQAKLIPLPVLGAQYSTIMLGGPTSVSRMKSPRFLAQNGRWVLLSLKDFDNRCL